MKSYKRKIVALLPERVERKLYEEYFVKEHKRWLKNKSPFPVSNLIKQTAILKLQAENNIKNFVETGTYFGDTIYSVYQNFEKLYSIELSDFFFQKSNSKV